MIASVQKEKKKWYIKAECFWILPDKKMCTFPVMLSFIKQQTNKKETVILHENNEEREKKLFFSCWVDLTKMKVNVMRTWEELFKLVRINLDLKIWMLLVNNAHIPNARYTVYMFEQTTMWSTETVKICPSFLCASSIRICSSTQYWFSTYILLLLTPSFIWVGVGACMCLGRGVILYKQWCL